MQANLIATFYLTDFEQIPAMHFPSWLFVFLSVCSFYDNSWTMNSDLFEVDLTIWSVASICRIFIFPGAPTISDSDNSLILYPDISDILSVI